MELPSVMEPAAFEEKVTWQSGNGVEILVRGSRRIVTQLTWYSDQIDVADRRYGQPIKRTSAKQALKKVGAWNSVATCFFSILVLQASEECVKMENGPNCCLVRGEC